MVARVRPRAPACGRTERAPRNLLPIAQRLLPGPRPARPPGDRRLGLSGGPFSFGDFPLPLRPILHVRQLDALPRPNAWSADSDLCSGGLFDLRRAEPAWRDLAGRLRVLSPPHPGPWHRAALPGDFTPGGRAPSAAERLP